MSPKSVCNDELLTLYLYQELAAAEHSALEEHLDGCESCRALLDELRSSLAAVPNPSLTLSAAEKQRFSAQVGARTSQPRGLSVPAWGTALAIVTVLGLMVLMLRPIRPPVTAVAPAATLAELEVLEQFDLLKELELLQDLELLQELG